MKGEIDMNLSNYVDTTDLTGSVNKEADKFFFLSLQITTKFTNISL